MRQVSSRLRVSGILVFALLIGSLSTFAQTRSTWSTAADIRSGARGAMVGTVNEILTNSFTLAPDRDRFGTTVRVTTDTLVTRYLGFGDDTGQIFSGGSGFARIRVGDRVEVRGVGGAQNTLAAEEVLLLGRAVTTPEGTTIPTTREGTVEGIVRSVRAEDNRLVIETGGREMLTILGSASTPVYYQGGTYRIRNIEVGDRVRVEVESGSSSGIRARIIDVLADATPEDQEPGREGRRTVTSIVGRVTRIDTRTQTFRLETDRARDVRVDARAAYDRAGNRFRLSDLQVGDRLEVSGEYDASENFRADTIRFSTDFDREEPLEDREDDTDNTSYTTVTVTGTLIEALSDDLIVVRDESRDRYRILVDRDFVVRNRSGGYIRASQLREGDRLEVRAFRDRAGRYIAQTIRIR